MQDRIFIDEATYKENLKNLKFVKPQDGDTLYFDKTSTVPRGNLAIAPIKRAVKLKPGCKVVLGPFCSLYFEQTFVFELDEENLLVITLGELRSAFYRKGYTPANMPISEEQILADPKAAIRTYITKDIEPYTLVYSGTRVKVNKKELNTTLHIANNVYKECIKDADLNEYLNSKQPSLTAEEAYSVMDMLESQDGDTQRIALQLLAQTSTTKIPRIHMAYSFLLCNLHKMECGLEYCCST